MAYPCTAWIYEPHGLVVESDGAQQIYCAPLLGRRVYQGGSDYDAADRFGIRQ